MKELSVDIETFSEVDIKDGMYNYGDAAEVILFACSEDKAPAVCYDVLSGEEIPDYIVVALSDPKVIKYAHNAPFEITVLCAYLGIPYHPEQWRCSSVKAGVAGYPLSLDGASSALGTIEQKDKEGKALIKYFCVPCRPTKVNGMRTRNFPHHALDKWLRFIEYCKQDVVTEQSISSEMEWVQISEFEQRLWVLDQHINRRGWKVDLDLAKSAIDLDADFRDRLTIEAKRITGLENPNSVAQLKAWIEEQEGIEIEGVTKDIVSKLIKTVTRPTTKRLLEIRLEMGKTSIKKYVAMLTAVSKDGRVRGLFQFYGAGRTGRWAGRLVQVQNLPRILLSENELMAARELVKNHDADMVELCFGSLSNILSQLIRTSFIPEKGKRLMILDFSAIEARILAWVAGEEWVLEVFRTHGKIYEATASKMFNIPLDQVTKAERQKGKVGTLLLGYQGGPDALIRMGVLEDGLLEEELEPLVKDWREINPKIVKFWYACQRTAIAAIETGNRLEVKDSQGNNFGGTGIYFQMKNKSLLLTLPSSRSLYFPQAAVEERLMPAKFEMQADGLGGFVKVCVREAKMVKYITFWAVDQYTRKWGKSSTYGGKLVENICQAISRDCLANAMLALDEVGYKIVSHVHDEIIVEMPEKVGSIEEMQKIMTRLPSWATGLPLGAAGEESYYYNK